MNLGLNLRLALFLLVTSLFYIDAASIARKILGKATDLLRGNSNKPMTQVVLIKPNSRNPDENLEDLGGSGCHVQIGLSKKDIEYIQRLEQEEEKLEKKKNEYLKSRGFDPKIFLHPVVTSLKYDHVDVKNDRKPRKSSTIKVSGFAPEHEIGDISDPHLTRLLHPDLVPDSISSKTVKSKNLRQASQPALMAQPLGTLSTQPVEDESMRSARSSLYNHKNSFLSSVNSSGPSLVSEFGARMNTA